MPLVLNAQDQWSLAFIVPQLGKLKFVFVGWLLFKSLLNSFQVSSDDGFMDVVVLFSVLEILILCYFLFKILLNLPLEVGLAP